MAREERTRGLPLATFVERPAAREITCLGIGSEAKGIRERRPSGARFRLPLGNVVGAILRKDDCDAYDCHGSDRGEGDEPDDALASGHAADDSDVGPWAAAIAAWTPPL